MTGIGKNYYERSVDLLSVQDMQAEKEGMIRVVLMERCRFTTVVEYMAGKAGQSSGEIKYWSVSVWG